MTKWCKLQSNLYMMCYDLHSRWNLVRRFWRACWHASTPVPTFFNTSCSKSQKLIQIPLDWTPKIKNRNRSTYRVSTHKSSIKQDKILRKTKNNVPSSRSSFWECFPSDLCWAHKASSTKASLVTANFVVSVPHTERIYLLEMANVNSQWNATSQLAFRFKEVPLFCNKKTVFKKIIGKSFFPSLQLAPRQSLHDHHQASFVPVDRAWQPLPHWLPSPGPFDVFVGLTWPTKTKDEQKEAPVLYPKQPSLHPPRKPEMPWSKDYKWLKTAWSCMRGYDCMRASTQNRDTKNNTPSKAIVFMVPKY